MIKSTKNSNDPIGNRTRDLAAYSRVPQPTAPPRAKLYPDLRLTDVWATLCLVWDGPKIFTRPSSPSVRILPTQVEGSAFLSLPVPWW